MPPQRPDLTVVADLDVDPAERSRRRARQHGTGAGVEAAFVARAVPSLLFGLVVDDAPEVGALLAERDDLPIVGSESTAGSRSAG